MPLKIPTGPLEPVAEVWARCVHRHHLQGLAAWAITSDGFVYVLCSDGWISEYVGWVPSSAEMQAMQKAGLPPGAMFAVAPPGEGQEGHFREVLACGRPTCEYRVALERNGTAQIHNLLRAMLKVGAKHHVIEVNRFLLDPTADFKELGVL